MVWNPPLYPACAGGRFEPVPCKGPLALAGRNDLLRSAQIVLQRGREKKKKRKGGRQKEIQGEKSKRRERGERKRYVSDWQSREERSVFSRKHEKSEIRDKNGLHMVEI